jgi:hypothetical protein
MQAVLECGRDAEVAAAAAQAPEEVTVLVLAARSCRPSAVTTSTAVRLSQAAPNRPSSQPSSDKRPAIIVLCASASDAARIC